MQSDRAAIVDDARAPSAPRLLVVDDIADNRDLIIRRFQRRNYEVDQADGGARALSMIETGRYDAVLLDVMMPEIEGLEVLRRLRAKYALEALPVIMVTGKTQSEDIVQALELGVNDYLTKPVDFAVALARVNDQVERKRAVEELERTVAVLKQSDERLEQEIASRKRSEALNECLTYYDSLTGLANRTLLKIAFPKRSPMRGGTKAHWRSFTSISTISTSSTRVSVMPPATNCQALSRAASSPASGKATRSPSESP